MYEHLQSSAPVSLEDFVKVKSSRRDRSRSKTVTSTTSFNDDRTSGYPYISEIEQIVEESPQNSQTGRETGTVHSANEVTDTTGAGLYRSPDCGIGNSDLSEEVSRVLYLCGTSHKLKVCISNPKDQFASSCIVPAPTCRSCNGSLREAGGWRLSYSQEPT